MPVKLVFACNDYRNGQPLGYTESVDVELGDEEIRLVGGRVKCDCLNEKLKGASSIEGDLTLCVGRKRIPCLGYEGWYGNWCCDRATVRAIHARTVVNYLAKRKDWHAEDCPAWFAKAFNVDRVVTAEQWKQELRQLAARETNRLI